jgi:glycosyltransferase involved in cell wall biosynthesis
MVRPEPNNDAAWSGSVLAIAPHAQFFIGEQLAAIRPYVRAEKVLVPSPFLADIVRRIPGMSGKYVSLTRAHVRSNDVLEEELLRPKYIHYPTDNLRRFAYVSAARASVRAIKHSRTEFQVVHSHFVGLHGFVGSSVKQAFGKPLVLSAYGGDVYRLPLLNEERKRIATSMIAQADRLIAVSKSVALGLTSLGANESRIVVVPTGFDDRLFGPSDQKAERASLGLPSERAILLTVANLVSQKGQIYLLEAMKTITKARKDVLLIIVGGGELYARLRQRTRDFQIDSNVVFVGPKAHDEIRAWMNACDLFVLPSIEEGSPTVITEAMACGKPTVASDVGGVSDLIGDEKQGILVSPGSPSELSEAILRSLDMKWDTNRIITRSKEFTWSSLARRIVKVYSEVSTE